MKSYNDMHYYKGDVYVRDSSSSDGLVEKEVLVQYNASDNKFLWEEKGMLYAVKYFYYSIENNEEKKIQYKEELDKYTLSTDIPEEDGVFYIKEDTLVEQKNMTKDVNFDLIEEFDKQHGLDTKYGKKK